MCTHEHPARDAYLAKMTQTASFCSEMLQENNFQVLKGIKNLGVLVYMCTFNAPLYKDIDIWLTLDKIVKGQHSLSDFDPEVSKQMDDFFSYCGLVRRHIFVTAVPMVIKPFELFDDSEIDERRRFLLDDCLTSVLNKGHYFNIFASTHDPLTPS